MIVWTINCMEDHFPGMWRFGFRHQCVAAGWAAEWGYPLSGKMTVFTHGVGRSRARSAIKRIEIGDFLIFMSETVPFVPIRVSAQGSDPWRKSCLLADQA